jgi:ribosomal protein S25
MTEMPVRVSLLEREQERSQREREKLDREKVDKETFQDHRTLVEKAFGEIKDDIKTLKRVVVSVGVAIVVAAIGLAFGVAAMVNKTPARTPTTISQR